MGLITSSESPITSGGVIYVEYNHFATKSSYFTEIEKIVSYMERSSISPRLINTRQKYRDSFSRSIIKVKGGQNGKWNTKQNVIFQQFLDAQICLIDTSAFPASFYPTDRAKNYWKILICPATPFSPLSPAIDRTVPMLPAAPFCPALPTYRGSGWKHSIHEFYFHFLIPSRYSRAFSLAPV